MISFSGPGDSLAGEAFSALAVLALKHIFYMTMFVITEIVTLNITASLSSHWSKDELDSSHLSLK